MAKRREFVEESYRAGYETAWCAAIRKIKEIVEKESRDIDYILKELVHYHDSYPLAYKFEAVSRLINELNASAR